VGLALERLTQELKDREGKNGVSYTLSMAMKALFFILQRHHIQ
jgi:hypothetical protein